MARRTTALPATGLLACEQVSHLPPEGPEDQVLARSHHCSQRVYRAIHGSLTPRSSAHRRNGGKRQAGHMV